jgi:hypothetical protein
MTKAEKEAECMEARVRLREILTPGKRVYTRPTHTTRGGNASLALLVATGGDEIRDLSPDVARALRLPFDREHGGVKFDGCGGEMVVHLCYALWGARYEGSGAFFGSGAQDKAGRQLAQVKL